LFVYLIRGSNSLSHLLEARSPGEPVRPLHDPPHGKPRSGEYDDQQRHPDPVHACTM
jgi:hypothetical protein